MVVQVLTAFCHALRLVRPAAAPGFCFAWLELVAHRAFLSRLLALTPQQKVILLSLFPAFSSLPFLTFLNGMRI